ncbi:hypothetical protein PPYR_03598 [Photinus pyralis]|uniref:non-specific serine/threonine protein kinase n=1 Tax=Photinus pyralis TaxID=7054 RepID=A0A1Y1K6D8_PHOPY|nr:serine/threonine-protein kinase pelle [Photinus pyralis]KAB0791798.1 hypothetical protein PPYR_03598 [Photinus pyralis]
MPHRSMYIYHLPHSERRELCSILDYSNKWEELGGTHMKYDFLTIQGLRKEIFRGNSPTEELLTLWGQQNHTVLELFILLSRMKHYQAMSVIKMHVDVTYHSLIQDGDDNLNCLLQDLALRNGKSSPAPVVHVPEEHLVNFDDRKVLNDGRIVSNNRLVPQVANNGPVSREDNDERLLKPKSPIPPRRGSGSNGPMSEMSCVAESAGAIPQIPYEELQNATNNWEPSAVLGKGGFGTVFRGTWKRTQVAIKRIEQKGNTPESHTEQIKQSITELHCLNAYRHDNVLPLYGYSIGGPQPCLVYQYMSGGSLEHRLRTKDPTRILSWPQRLNVSIGTARGLQFLHTIGEKPLIHGDIKPANILLDPCDNAKIGDFGLAREGPQSDYTHVKVSRIHGTGPYLPADYLRSKKMSTKVDTYSFGVLLFELATALHVYVEQRPDKFLRDHIDNYKGDILDLKDGRAPDGDNCFRSFIEIGKVCVNRRAKDRPEMVEVLISLEQVSL